MASAQGIRAGAAYVEISADDSPMVRRLQESRARLRQWVAQNSGTAMTRGTEAAVMAQGDDRRGFLSGGYRGMEIAETGLKLATAIASAKIAIKDVQIFSSLFRGDMEGARKAAEELPFGLGAIVKELSGPVDWAANRFVERMRGLEWGELDRKGPSGDRERLASVEQYNRGVTGIAAIEKALAKATMSARDWAKAEVDALDLSADHAARLLALKTRLIEVDEQRAAAAKTLADRERGADLIRQAMDQHARMGMSEREVAGYEVRHMGLAADQARTLLNWRLAILDATERQAAAQRRLAFDTSFADAIGNLKDRIAELRGELDALARDEATAMEPLMKAFAEGAIDMAAFAAKTAELRQLFTDLRAAQGEAEAKREGETLTEAMRTPEEQARDQVERYKALREGGHISEETYQRAVRKAVEDAASALPDVARATVGVRGTFSALEAPGLGAGGVTDRIARASEETARNTEKIAVLTASLGVSFN
jgi:hypothetical protein